jgi:hypothetical protein
MLNAGVLIEQGGKGDKLITRIRTYCRTTLKLAATIPRQLSSRRIFMQPCEIVSHGSYLNL